MMEDLDKDAKDLIKKLLRKCPLRRLGAGPKGSKYSLEELMNHPFFQGESFEKMQFKTPPFSQLEKEKYLSNYFKNADLTSYE